MFAPIESTQIDDTLTALAKKMLWVLVGGILGSMYSTVCSQDEDEWVMFEVLSAFLSGVPC